MTMDVTITAITAAMSTVTVADTSCAVGSG